ncbi:hypothetical protein [Cohnella silvisoli]|uniref:Toxic anion resistance protein n=1 Tax=Cohnella silvisoli TaxID=2873699 RepID=A0ABV1KTU0_9BACL|nr:hypothetical protein [Cohnella silvisoli]MCD9022584.1 hypothetical protein [Cohnella silvisoli]
MRIQGQTLSPALSAFSPKPAHAQSPDGGQSANIQSTVTISQLGNAKHDLLQRFRTPIDGSGNRASLIVSIADKYGEIRNEIISEGKDDQQQSLTQLDQVYDELTAGSAEQLSSQFNYFFDSSGDDLFDEKAFRSHLVDLAKAAKQIAVEHPGEVADRLALRESSGGLETMNYRDIVSMVDVMQKLSANKPPEAGSDPVKFGSQLAEWHTYNKQILASADLSDDVRKAAERALDTSATFRMKNGAFKQAIDQFNAKIEETLKKLKRLSFLLATLNGKLQDLKGLDPGDPRIQSLLRREQELMQSKSEYWNELKENNTKMSQLKKNPDSVIETDVYRQIKDSYDTRMEQARADK